MKIFNTLSRTKEEFLPIIKGEYRIYVCGPTVYNYIHVGNARPLVVFDVLRRYLEYLGNKVIFVSNITDIDDKLIKKAAEENTTVTALAKRYEDEFCRDKDALGCLPATFMPRATEHIAEMTDMVNKLLGDGFAYKAGGDIYFRTTAFKEYGKLCNQPMEELFDGARVETTQAKESPADFTLWKGAKPGEPVFSAPFGEGRPGWHLECSAMAKRYLGETFDLHGGGIDLVFPHHENEIAQSEAANKKPFARFFMHNGFLTMGEQKMSKSAGNFFTVREVAEEFGYMPIRFLLLSAHYRSPLSFTRESLQQSTSALSRIQNTRSRLDLNLTSAKNEGGNLTDECKKAHLAFCAAMDDDLNTADALAAIFNLTKAVNTGDKTLSRAGLKEAAATLDTLCGILGLDLKQPQDDFPKEAMELLEQRIKAKTEKDFTKADNLRKQLFSMGFSVEDTKNGTKLVGISLH